ncbi:MBL fold metallo-hydrolase [Nocardia uniformis]|uniref:MBL fold metallo-hydrolase n=1 Tax=Nocardia uniformis TaxID=53432 RepID=A0A849C1I3_9NOCA|nr:MBL fold metallo-hydrolase [Nocardia uniformis]NNH72603.1 MBL fold metallo-hydrolase [Nocardia uniformis]
MARIPGIKARLTDRFPGLADSPLPIPTLAETIAARRHFFGDAIDPETGAVRENKVAAAWFGCAGFAIAMGGNIFLLDAWVPRGMTSGYVPTTPAELAALRPAAIFIGHGHFDHAADAGPIAQASGAVMHGTAAHCATIRKQVAFKPEFDCVELGSDASLPGERHDFELTPGLQVTAIRHLHSAPTRRGPEASARVSPRPCLGDVRTHRPTLADAAHLARNLSAPEGGTLLYQFRTTNFTLTWHDSSGPLADRAPHVLDVLRDLPPSDVHIGAVQGFNQFTNGLRDPRNYIEALRAKVFIPNHHDNWLPLITARGEAFRTPLHAEIAKLPEVSRPEIRMLIDPDDYVSSALMTFE